MVKVMMCQSTQRPLAAELNPAERPDKHPAAATSKEANGAYKKKKTEWMK